MSEGKSTVVASLVAICEEGSESLLDSVNHMAHALNQLYRLDGHCNLTLSLKPVLPTRGHLQHPIQTSLVCDTCGRIRRCLAPHHKSNWMCKLTDGPPRDLTVLEDNTDITLYFLTLLLILNITWVIIYIYRCWKHTKGSWNKRQYRMALLKIRKRVKTAEETGAGDGDQSRINLSDDSEESLQETFEHYDFPTEHPHMEGFHRQSYLPPRCNQHRGKGFYHSLAKARSRKEFLLGTTPKHVFTSKGLSKSAAYLLSLRSGSSSELCLPSESLTDPCFNGTINFKVEAFNNCLMESAVEKMTMERFDKNQLFRGVWNKNGSEHDSSQEGPNMSELRDLWSDVVNITADRHCPTAEKIKLINEPNHVKVKNMNENHDCIHHSKPEDINDSRKMSIDNANADQELKKPGHSKITEKIIFDNQSNQGEVKHAPFKPLSQLHYLDERSLQWPYPALSSKNLCNTVIGPMPLCLLDPLKGVYKQDITSKLFMDNIEDEVVNSVD